MTIKHKPTGSLSIPHDIATGKMLAHLVEVASQYTDAPNQSVARLLAMFADSDAGREEIKRLGRAIFELDDFHCSLLADFIQETRR